jgi:hypothetical protein
MGPPAGSTVLLLLSSRDGNESPLTQQPVKRPLWVELLRWFGAIAPRPRVTPLFGGPEVNPWHRALHPTANSQGMPWEG